MAQFTNQQGLVIFADGSSDSHTLKEKKRKEKKRKKI